MCAAPMQYERSTTSSSGSPAATRTSTRSTCGRRDDATTRAPARAPSRRPRTHVSSSTGAGTLVAGSGRAARPRPSSSAPSTSTVLLGEWPRAQRRRRGRSRQVARAPTPSCRSTRVRQRPAEVGRDVADDRPGDPHGSAVEHRRGGDRWALRPEPYDVLARVARRARAARARSASSRAAGGAIERSLPPNAPPFASGDAGSPPGSHHDASGSRYAGSTQRRREAHAAAGAGGSASGGRLAAVVRRPWTLPACAARLRERSDARRTHGSPRARPANGDQQRRAARCRRRSRPRRAARRAPTRCGDAALDRGASARPPPSRERTGARGSAPRRARSPRSTVCHPVHRQRCAASMRSTSAAAFTDPRSRSHAARTRMPGVQKPHCEPPVATNADASRSRSSGASPSRVVTDRPATRVGRASRTPRGARRRRARCSSRTDPAARSRPSPMWIPRSLAEDVEQRWRPVATSTSTGRAVAGERPPDPTRSISTRQDRTMPAETESLARAFLAGAGSWFVGMGRHRHGARSRRRGCGVGGTHRGKRPPLSPLVLSSDLYASPDPQRLAFAIAKGARYASGRAGTGALRAARRAARGRCTTTELHRAGLPKGRGVYVADVVVRRARACGTRSRSTQGRKRAVRDRGEGDATEAPVVGAAAPRAPSPTLTDDARREADLHTPSARARCTTCRSPT